MAVALAQYGYVLEMSPPPAAFFAPALVGALFGALVAATRTIGDRARRLSIALAASERAVRELNAGLEAAVADRTAELARQAEALVRAQRLEVVGRLAGGVAHDFNNILTAVVGCAAALRDEVGALPPERAGEAQGLLDELDASVARASALSQQLLTLSRSHPASLGPVDLAALVRQLQPMLQRFLSGRISLEVSSGPEACTVVADRLHLEQLVLNLAVNARDAMPHGGTLTVWTVREGGLVVLTVADTGVGMDEATRARMFDPFFTTKPPGHGTGLGLAVVQEVVRRSGADIRVTSAPGRGTRVTVAFPVAESAPTAAARADAPVHALRTPLTVLLVEDDDAVRRPLAAALARAGHTVLEAADGLQAEEHATRRGREIDVVVSDVILGSTTGPALVGRLAAMGVTVPVVLMTGYSPEEIDLGPAAREAPLLQKPFPPSLLLERIAEAAGSDRAATTRTPAHIPPP
jgi:two-component system cell cycle sensor histidine kinase/response regulator CckA